MTLYFKKITAVVLLILMGSVFSAETVKAKGPAGGDSDNQEIEYITPEGGVEIYPQINYDGSEAVDITCRIINTSTVEVSCTKIELILPIKFGDSYSVHDLQFSSNQGFRGIKPVNYSFLRKSEKQTELCIYSLKPGEEFFLYTHADFKNSIISKAPVKDQLFEVPIEIKLTLSDDFGTSKKYEEKIMVDYERINHEDKAPDKNQTQDIIVTLLESGKTNTDIPFQIIASRKVPNVKHVMVADTKTPGEKKKTVNIVMILFTISLFLCIIYTYFQSSYKLHKKEIQRKFKER